MFMTELQKEAWNNYVKSFKQTRAYQEYPWLYWMMWSYEQE